MELCKTCKNKNCKKSIVTIEEPNMLTIKCVEYEKDESKIEGYKEPLEILADRSYIVKRER